MRDPARHARSVIVVAAGIALLVALSAGLPRTAHAEKRAISGSLTGQLRMITARMVSGKFSAICPASNQSMTSNVNLPDRREKLSISLAGGKPSVGYEALTSRERFAITIDQGDALSLQLAPQSEAEGTLIDFSQAATGAIHLTIGSGKEVREIRAQSIWQLMLIEPEACQTHLVPLLQLIRPDWRLKQQADTIEEFLCRTVESQPAANRAVWRQAVTDLASPRFAERERAEQKLLEGGQNVLPLLQVLPRAKLDAEQMYRVRRIVRQVTGAGDEDTPGRVAFWLAEDPRVWHALASRDDVAKRRVAASRLVQILPPPVEFDPEGTAEQRAEQLTRIREQHAESFNAPVLEKTTTYQPHRPAPAAQSQGWSGFRMDTF
jgi:hypothetical protein